MRRDHPDGNAKELCASLEAHGWRVQRIASAVQRSAGVPDAIVSRRGSRLNHFLEIKSAKGHLNPNQFNFIGLWPGCVHIASSSFVAEELLKECEAINGAGGQLTVTPIRYDPDAKP